MANTLLDKFLLKRKEELCAKLKEAFAVFDKEKTGFIKREDFGNVMRSIGENPTDDEVKDVIDAIEFDKKGAVECSRFLNFMVTLRDSLPKEAFRNIDKDEDGFITAAELSVALSSLGEAVTVEEAKLMIQTAGLDGDGKLRYEDFKKMLIQDESDEDKTVIQYDSDEITVEQ